MELEPSNVTCSGNGPAALVELMTAVGGVVSVVVVVPSEVLPSVELVSSVVEVVLSPLEVGSVVVGVVVVVPSEVLPSVVVGFSVVEVVSPLDVVSVGDEVVVSVEVSAGTVKEIGAEWGLSVPSLSMAVSVKLEVSLVSVTVQSMVMAAGSMLWQAKTPSW